MDIAATNSEINILRLGLCEVCAFVDAKYTCPKCEVKTCCLQCLNIHKKELDCNGVRDKTKFIPIKNMTEMDFKSDYTFLEECTRYVADRKRDTMKRFTRFNKNLPAHKFKLRCAAHDRRTTLRFLLALFNKHTENTTFYDWKTKIIHWRIEWVFPNAGNIKFIDERSDEGESLETLLSKYVQFQPKNDKQTDIIRKSLEFYQARGSWANMRVLLKAEGVKKCKNRFFELDVDQSLKENLAGRTIVEFPSIYVVYDDVVKEFDVIDSDDDIDRETELYQKELYGSARTHRSDDGNESVTDEQKSYQTKKRREERRLKRAKLAKTPQNLLFADEQTLDAMSSDTDSGDQTEEEAEVVAAKRIKTEDM